MTDEQSSSGMSLALIEEQADTTIRREWVGDRWYFSVVDVVGVLTYAPRPRQYWYDMRRRITDEGFRELSAKCRQLKLRAADGKRYSTDAADTETLLRIIQSIPSPKAEPVKQWLAREGAKRLDDVTRPLPAPQVATAIAAIDKPADEAPALAWAEYYERMAALTGARRRMRRGSPSLRRDKTGWRTAWRALKKSRGSCPKSWSGWAHRRCRRNIRRPSRQWLDGCTSSRVTPSP